MWQGMANIAGWHARPLPAMQASYIVGFQDPDAPFLIQLPVYVPGKAVEHSPGAWTLHLCARPGRNL